MSSFNPAVEVCPGSEQQQPILEPEMMRCSTGSSSECHLSSSSSGSDGVPAIFLSHSGKQKPFVENLFSALQRANHTAFFDQHTLPKGSTFPHLIFTAARGCELGIVVLSEDFLTSKWPMIELEILVLQRGPKAKVWEEKAGAPDVVVKWGEALRALNAFNGEIFTQDTSEALYINRVVHNVCKVLPSPLPEDLSPIKGLYRLAKEVSGQFDNSRQCEEACLMGLHGVGGLGKTTMCKIMVNFYSAEYPGRCHHLQFPTDGKDMPQIVHVCKKVLKELTKLSHELLLNKADNFDQIYELALDGLVQLETLDGHGESISTWEFWVQLKALHVARCEWLKRMPDLSRLACLGELVLDENKTMEGVGGFGPAALKFIRISGCYALKSTPNLSGCTRLEVLELSNNGFLEVQGVLSSTLRVLVIDGGLKKIPDLSGLAHLERLQLHEFWMEELGGLSSTIRMMGVFMFPALN
ncbi:hypothetical protein GOP47_0028417 [Adiantum capillus-veneris]|nr:hypothetical protein GOP47_0028417 [Adiantum capillus-veneris]